MQSRARLLGHAIHPMLVHFPIGLLGMAVVFDIVSVTTESTALAAASYYMIAAGVVSGAVAAIFGIIDWLAIPPGTRARSIGTWHARGNVMMLLLFAASWWLRRSDPLEPSALAIGLALIGGALSLVTGWLGGELVSRLAVSVDEGAHLNAPSSLTERPAREGDRAR